MWKQFVQKSKLVPKQKLASEKRDWIFSVLIDYDNLHNLQKTSGILDVITKALVQIPIQDSISRVKCEVRIYGGWYEESNITRLAQDVVVEIQNDFPNIIRISNSQKNLVPV